MLKILIGLAIGGAIGAIVGWKGRCATGACPLTSNPYIGGIYGALLGALFAGLWASPSATGESRGRATLGAVETTTATLVSAPPGTETTAAADAESPMTTKVKVVHVASVEEFDRLIRDSRLPVLVDFWATWCAPCRVQAKILDELSGDLAGRVVLAKVDVDELGALARRYRIQGIPTLIVFEKGGLHEIMVGVQTKDTLRRTLKLGES